MAKYAVILAVLVGVVGCADSKDPLSSRVDSLEAQVAALQADQTATQRALLDSLQTGQTETQRALLDSLNHVPATALTTTEIGDLRAELTRTDLDAAQLEQLRTRVDALLPRTVDWTAPVAQASGAVYAVMEAVTPGTIDSAADVTDTSAVHLTFLGTAFAVDGQTLITNGHMVDALKSLDGQVQQYNVKNGTRLRSDWIVVQNGTTTLRYGENYFIIAASATHPEWDGQSNTADVGLLRVLDGALPHTLQLMTADQARSLAVGQPIATLGFPGELQAGSLDNFYPIATFKDGTISALRPPLSGQPYTDGDTWILQHNLDLSGGTSGSPIFDPQGVVVAVNNSGIEAVIPSFGRTTPSRVTQAALGFGIRADKIDELLAVQPAARPVAAPEGSHRLDGLRVGDLHPWPGAAR